VSTRWAVELGRAEAASAARLRGASDVTACWIDDTFWLQGLGDETNLPDAVRGLPGPRYRIEEDGRLFRPGHRLPSGRLPAGPWIPLAVAIGVAVPSPAFAASVPRHGIPLALVRGGPPREANLLVTTLDSFHAWAIHASQVRLERLGFAVNPAGETVIRGTPLPTILGTRFVETDRIAVEAGWRFEPDLEPKIIRQVLRLASGDVAVIRAELSWHNLPDEAFVQASRSAVRLTQREQHGHGHQHA
jgi:hypothetical protein